MKTLNQLKEVKMLPNLTEKIKEGTKSQKSLEQTEKIWEEKLERVRLKNHNRK